MEYVPRSSTVNRTMPSERLDFDTESSDSSSSNECSYLVSSKNQRKCFWKGGGDYSGAKVSQNCVKNKKKHRKETKTVCTLVRKNNVRNVGHSHSVPNKHAIIKLTNVPVKMNNILDLYHNFIRFGTITMIQAQRNSNPYCAILSFLYSKDAKNAMENASKIIPNVRAIWFMDVCLSSTYDANYVYTDDTCSSSQNTSNRCKLNDIILSDKRYRTQQLFNADDRNHNIPNYDTKYDQNLETLITELIRKKNRLLSQQMNSMREIIQKINKCEIGGREEKILLELLKKVQIQVQENRKSIDYSVKQRNEYFAKRKMLTTWKGVENPTTACPPWISAFKTASAKRAQYTKYEEKRRKSSRVVRVFPISDDDSSTSDSEKASADSRDELSSKYYSICCRKSATKGSKKLHDERFECEMTHLLSDDGNCHEND